MVDSHSLYEPLTIDRTAVNPASVQESLVSGAFFDNNLYRAGIRGYLCEYHVGHAPPIEGMKDLLNMPSYRFQNTPAFTRWIAQLRLANEKLNTPVDLSSFDHSSKVTLISYLMTEEQIIQRYVGQFAELPLQNKAGPSEMPHGRPGGGIAHLMLMNPTYASDDILVSYFFNRHNVRSDTGSSLTYEEWLSAIQPKKALWQRLGGSLKQVLTFSAKVIFGTLYSCFLPFAIVAHLNAPPVAFIAVHLLMFPFTVALLLYLSHNHHSDACDERYSVNFDERYAAVVNTFVDNVGSWQSLLSPRNFEQRYTLRAYYFMMQQTPIDSKHAVKKHGHASYTHLHIKDYARMAVSQLEHAQTA